MEDQNSWLLYQGRPVRVLHLFIHLFITLFKVDICIANNINLNRLTKYIYIYIYIYIYK